MTKNHSKGAKLDIDMRNRNLEAAGQTQRLLQAPVELGYKVEQQKDEKKKEASQMLAMMLKRDSSIVALDTHIKNQHL